MLDDVADKFIFRAIKIPIIMEAIKTKILASLYFIINLH